MSVEQGWRVVEIKGRTEKVNPDTAVARIVDETEDEINIRLDDTENLPFWMEITLRKGNSDDDKTRRSGKDH